MPNTSRKQAVHQPQHQPATTASDTAPPERLLRIDDVCHQTGLGRSTVYAMVKDGKLPAPVQLHGAAVAWLQTEVQAWIAGRPRVAPPAAAPRRLRMVDGLGA